jgi:hypothetical protein
MTIGEASILIGIIFLILTNIAKILTEKTSSDKFEKILNRVMLVQEIQTSKQRRFEEDHGVLKNRVDNHDAEFSNVRKEIREITA